MTINPGKSLPPSGLKPQRDQLGQSLIEFVLLLLVIVTLSFAFIRISNTNLAKYWEEYARLIVDDPSENGNLRI